MVAKSIATNYTNIHKPTDYNTSSRSSGVAIHTTLVQPLVYLSDTCTMCTCYVHHFMFCYSLMSALITILVK